MRHLTTEELHAGLDGIRQSPKDEGVLELIVRRPRIGEREVLDEGQLDVVEGLVGDTWSTRSSRRSKDGLAHPDMQLNIMNARVIALVAQDRERWHLAGDQLFMDLDLSAENLPPGTRLAVGSAVIEVTDRAAHRVSEVRVALRARRDEVRQFAGGPRAQSARHQRQGGAAGNDPRRATSPKSSAGIGAKGLASSPPSPHPAPSSCHFDL